MIKKSQNAERPLRQLLVPLTVADTVPLGHHTEMLLPVGLVEFLKNRHPLPLVGLLLHGRQLTYDTESPALSLALEEAVRPKAAEACLIEVGPPTPGTLLETQETPAPPPAITLAALRLQKLPPRLDLIVKASSVLVEGLWQTAKSFIQTAGHRPAIATLFA